MATTERPRRRFTTAEYHRMLEVGILYSGEPVELLAGEIYETASIGSRHAACVRGLAELLGEALRDRALVSVQSPIELSEDSEPEPDLALLRRRADRYSGAHPRPGDVFLVVEVGDANYLQDRRLKLPLYADARVEEVWIVRLANDTVEAYRDPVGRRYTTDQTLGPGDSLSLQRFPDTTFAVSDILPSRPPSAGRSGR